MLNPQFIINAMQEMDARFYTIEDASGHPMYEQWQNVSLDKSIERFKNFVKNCSSNSQFVIYLYKDNKRLKNGEPTAANRGMRYEVWVDDNNFDSNQGMTGVEANPQTPQHMGVDGIAESMYRVGTMGSIGLDTYLTSKDEIMSLKLKIQQLEMENKYLQDKHQQEMSRLEKDYEDKLSSDKKIEGIIGSVLPAMGLGGGMAGINGIGAVAEEKSTKTIVIEAVNVLLKHDADFVHNIQNLAKLAQSNPQVYKMAVEQLNKLS